MTLNKRPSFVNFPIPFDHPYTIPTLAAALTASAVLYYSLQASHNQDLIEALRQRTVYKRRQAKLRNEDKFASLKIENKFVNPFVEFKHDESTSLWDSILFWLGINKSEIPLDKELEKLLPVLKPQLKKQTSELSVTWLGQSTCLFTLDGVTVLTDPIFDNYIKYNMLNTVKRLRPPPIPIDDIKDKLDIVLVTNNHLDHLDENVVNSLGNTVTWYIPLGLRDWFVSKGVENVIELDWWQEIHHKERPDILIACVPAMHSSGSRTSFNKNQSLWCSFVIKSKSDKIFFCGDTGYVPELFQAIGELYSPFTVATLPIGRSEPVKSLYMSPEEAVKAHTDLGSPKISVGIHWGTFMRSNEPFLSPVHQLAQVWKEEDAENSSRFITLSHGETLFID